MHHRAMTYRSFVVVGRVVVAGVVVDVVGRVVVGTPVVVR
jgi:hypothetical protein